MATHDNSLSMPDWFEARLATDDMLDALRQLPVIPMHRHLITVMWFDTRGKAHRFATVKGVVFGRTSAVNAFLQVSHFCGGTGTTHRCRPGHGIC